jgi:hypothetical protein
MTEDPIQQRLADLETALGREPASSLPLPKLEDLKAWLDDTRNDVWDRLKAAQAPEEANVGERFRLRRATEMCQRLAADLRDGRLLAEGLDLSELSASVSELGAALGSIGR